MPFSSGPVRRMAVAPCPSSTAVMLGARKVTVPRLGVRTVVGEVESGGCVLAGRGGAVGASGECGEVLGESLFGACVEVEWLAEGWSALDEVVGAEGGAGVGGDGGDEES